MTPDLPLGIGRWLAAGEVVVQEFASPTARHPIFDIPVFDVAVARPKFRSCWIVDIVEGPDASDFGDVHEVFQNANYLVGAESNGIGLRLSGRTPLRRATGEVVSQGVPIGAIEVPSFEELLVLHRGRGVTAGYAIPAVATATGLDTLAQVRPGDSVRFRWSSIRDAISTHRDRVRNLDDLEVRVAAVFAAHGVGGTSVSPVANLRERISARDESPR